MKKPPCLEAFDDFLQSDVRIFPSEQAREICKQATRICPKKIGNRTKFDVLATENKLPLFMDVVQARKKLEEVLNGVLCCQYPAK